MRHAHPRHVQRLRRALAAGASVAALIAFPDAAAADAAGGVLGPTGYKSLQIGGSVEPARASGLVVDRTPTGDCTLYRLRPEEGKPNLGGGVFVDLRDRVVIIGGTNLIRTREGITMGSDRAAVERAYGPLTPVPPQDYIFTADVPGDTFGARYRFAFDNQGLVSDFALQSADTGGCGTTKN